MKRVAAVLLAVCLVLAAGHVLQGNITGRITGTVPENLTNITVGLSWVHQAQFSGEYYADQYGLYEREGLRVKLVPGSIDVDPIEKLVSGEYDFILAQPDTLLKAKSEGKKIRAVAATYRIHPLVFASLPEKGIKMPADLKNKTIGVAYSEDLVLNVMLKMFGIDPEKDVNIVQRGYTFDELYSGELDVTGAWVTDEIQTEKRKGNEFSLVYPPDYGIIFYADLITTTDDMIENRPETAEKFLRATLEGWREALMDAEEHSRLALSYDESLGPLHELDVLEASLPLIHTGEDRIGWMKSGCWEMMYSMMIAEGLFKEPFDVRDAYTMEFLDKVYGK